MKAGDARSHTLTSLSAIPLAVVFIELERKEKRKLRLTLFRCGSKLSGGGISDHIKERSLRGSWERKLIVYFPEYKNERELFRLWNHTCVFLNGDWLVYNLWLTLGRNVTFLKERNRIESYVVFGKWNTFEKRKFRWKRDFLDDFLKPKLWRSIAG